MCSEGHGPRPPRARCAARDLGDVRRGCTQDHRSSTFMTGRARSARGPRRCALKPDREADIVDEIAQRLAERYRRGVGRPIAGGADTLGARRVQSRQHCRVAHRSPAAGARACRRHGGRLDGTPVRGSQARPALRREGSSVIEELAPQWLSALHWPPSRATYR
jgi:hypothetical protein